MSNSTRTKKNSKKIKRNRIIVAAVAFVVVAAAIFGITQIAGKDNDGTKVSKSSKTSEVTMIMVGDNLYHKNIINYGKQSDGTYDFEAIYEPVKDEVESADIAIVNQETILGGSSMEYTGYPTFNTPWEAGDALEATGFDILACASNHSMDKGEKGLQGAFEFFENHPNLTEIGINQTEDEYETIDYYEKNGITFAFLNYTYDTNGISQPSDKPWSVNLLDEEKITEDVTKAKEKADVVVVLPHWGTEYSTTVSEEQKKYTQLFSDLGVDIVIGTHPHVIEPVEWVTNEETGKKMLVYYSLGNFVSNQPDAITQLGAMAKVTIQKTGDEITITEATAIPLVTHVVDNPLFVRVYKLEDYTDELASKNHSYSSVEYFTQKANEILGEFSTTYTSDKTGTTE